MCVLDRWDEDGILLVWSSSPEPTISFKSWGKHQANATYGRVYEMPDQYSWKLSKTKSETPHSQEEPLETWWLNVTSDPGWDPGIEKRILGENEGYLLDVCAQLLQSCPTLCDAMDCRQLGSSVHGISQARILEWVATPSSRVSSQPKDLTCVSCTGRWILYPLGHLWTLVNNNTLESVH